MSAFPAAPVRLPACSLPVLLMLLTLLSQAAHAQEETVTTGGPDLRVRLGGVFQSRLSYGWTTNAPAERERVGYGIRRARLQVNGAVGPRAGFYLQVDGAGGTVQALDAFAFYQFNERLRLRLGRMASAQPRAMILTPAPLIDAIDRAAVAEIWAARTVGADGRDFGLDLRYRTPQGEVLVFLHNGDGNWDRARGNFREAVTGDATGGADRGLRDLAVSVYGTLTPAALKGVEVGGYVAFNGARNPNTEAEGRGREYVSYAGHLYWGAVPGSQPVRLKADVVGVRYETVEGVTVEVRDQHTLGYALLGAARVHPAAEVFARVEQFLPNVNRSGTGDTFAVAGASFSLSALRGRPYQHERLSVAYAGRFPEDGPRQHLVVLQAQIVF